MKAKVKKAALFVLRDKEGRVLLQHRDEFAPTNPNYWGFFGGGIEKGESAKEAVKREAKEELGIELKNLELFKEYKYKTGNGVLKEKYVFTAPLKSSIEKLKKQQAEGDCLGLFSFDDLEKLKLIDFDKIILKELFNKKLWKK